MSKTPWDNGGMDPHQNYGANTPYKYDYGNFNQQMYDNRWNQNDISNPQEYHNHMPTQSLDSFNQSSVLNSNEPSDNAFIQTSSGYDASNYGHIYTGNSPHWPNQFDPQNHYNPHQYPQYADNYYPYENYVNQPQHFTNQQLQNVETNQHQQQTETFNNQELVNKSEDEAKYENIPLNEEVVPSLPSQFSLEEMQSLETSSHSSDQQVLPLASEPPTASSSSDLPQLGLNVGPPPVGTMTGIPTRNQFRKAPLKKSYHQDKTNDYLPNYHGSMELLQSDQKVVVSPGSGDHVDLVADSSSVATEESLDQKLADNEVALYNQACPSPSSNHESAIQPSEQSTQPEELLIQAAKTLPVIEIEAKHGKDVTKPNMDDANPLESQTRSSDLFNPLQYLSRKKPHRDSTLSPATTLWDNIDVSPLKLGPKLVPAQEFEPSLDDEKRKTAQSPNQNTGTGPSHNLISIPELSSANIFGSFAEKTSILSNDPASLDSLTSASLDSSSLNSQEVLHLANPKVENLTSIKEVSDLMGTYEVSSNQVSDVQISSIQSKPSSSQSQSIEQQSIAGNQPETSALKQQVISNQQHMPLPQPQHIAPQQQPQYMPPQQQPQHVTSQQQPQYMAPQQQPQHVTLQQQPQHVTPQQQPQHMTSQQQPQYMAPQQQPQHIAPQQQQQHMPLQQQQCTPPQQTLESDLQKKSIPLVTSQISDPLLSAFSAVKTAAPANSSDKTHGVPGNSYGARGSVNASSNRKTTYSALNPEPNPVPNVLKQNDEMMRRQEIIHNESQKHQEVRPLSRQMSDIPKYEEHSRRHEVDTSLRHDVDPSSRVKEWDFDSSHYGGSQGYYDERINPPSRQGDRIDGQFHERSNKDYGYYNQRPESRSHYEDQQRPRDGRQQVDPTLRPAYEDQYQERNSMLDYNGPRSYSSHSKLHYDERLHDQSSRTYLPDGRYQTRPQYSRSSSPSRDFQNERRRQDPARDSYPYDRPFSRHDERDSYRNDDARYQGSDRNVHRRDKFTRDAQSVYSNDEWNSRDIPPKYPQGRYREREDPYARDPRDYAAYREREAYNRPRSRQEVEYAELEKQKQYLEFYNNYCRMFQNWQVMDPYGGYYNYNPYSQGFYDEMNSYAQNQPLDTSMAEMEAAGLSSRASSRNFNSADQFARDSQGGSRSESRMSGYNPEKNATRVEEKKRLTPFKHNICHVRASFSASGQLVQVMPNIPTFGQPAVVRILSLCDQESEEVVDLNNYPGPLGRGIHKNDVQDFCKQMSLKCKDDGKLNDRSSAQLIWDFLSLLIKQNGSIIGADISELLIQGKDPNLYDDNLSAEDDDINSTLRTGFDRSIVSHQSDDLTADQITNQFRYLLLYGRKKDALDWAMKRNLWGHALYLASQMDAKTHAAVKTKFTNVSIRANDPLQTLYQILSGRQPSSVTLLDQKWGDWRPHLSMIVSNSTSKPELDKRSIVTLGDNLATHGLLHASHFCYLVSQTIFGGHNTKNSKLVLIGSKHGQPLMEFATNSSIWATEVYEYAISLANPSFCLTSLVIYKFIYMIRLIDLGLFEEALRYAEVIAQAIIGAEQTSSDLDARTQEVVRAFSPGIIRFVAHLSSSLKMWDPHRDSAGLEGEVEQDPIWCSKLMNIARMAEDGSIRFRSLSPHLSSTGANSEMGELMMGVHQNMSGVDLSDSQWTGHNYKQNVESQNLPIAEGTNPYLEHNWTNEQQFWSNQQSADQSQSNSAYTQNIFSPAYSMPYIPPQGSLPPNQQQQPELVPFQHQQQYPAFTIGSVEGDKIPEGPRHEVQHGQHHHHHHHSHQQGMAKGSRSRTTSSGSNASRKSSVVAPSSPRRNWDDPFQFGVPPAISNNNLMSGMNQALGAHNPPDQPKKRQALPNDDSDDFEVKNEKPPVKQAGWGLLKWFGGNKSKEVELPDDSKDPAVVWDPEKKRWKNTDGDGSEDQELAPPPIFQSPAAAKQDDGLNRFSMGARPRGTRGPYTDVLQGSTNPALAVSASLLNVLPKSASTPANIFNPAMLAQDESDSPAQNQDLQQEQSHHQQPPSQHHQHLGHVPNNHQQHPAYSNKYFDPSQRQTVPQHGSRQPPLMNQRVPRL